MKAVVLRGAVLKDNERDPVAAKQMLSALHSIGEVHGLWERLSGRPRPRPGGLVEAGPGVPAGHPPAPLRPVALPAETGHPDPSGWGPVDTPAADARPPRPPSDGRQTGGPAPFAREVEPADIVTLPKYRCYARLLIDGVPGKLFSFATLPPSAPAEFSGRQATIRRLSRERYCRPSETVETT